jgi:uncharacterized membrane protein (DUF106 family)
MGSLLVFIIIAIIVVLIIRLLGAWMLRINELIRYQKQTIELLQKQVQIQSKLNSKIKSDEIK